jgi:hypothetical protein
MMDFTVIKVTLTLKLTGSVDDDNSRKSIVNNGVGRTTLGTATMNSGVFTPVDMSTMIEIIGAISPNDFDQDVKFVRTAFEWRLYIDNSSSYPSPYKRYVNCPDTSPFQFQDNSPRSGGSAGKVYDVDSPGLHFISSDAVGTKLRQRINFVEWLAIYQANGTSNEDVRVSTDISWFHRLSIVKNGTDNYSVLTDVSTVDNIVSAGSTPLTNDLGSNDGTLPSPANCRALTDQLP